MGAWQASSRRRTIDGAGIHYTAAGIGETVLLVHGMPTSSFLWRGVQERLSTELRAVAVDLLGCGRSDKPERCDLSLEGQAERLARFALALDAGPVTLVAHDWGAAIAQVLAARTPGVLARLVLVGARTAATWPAAEYARFRAPDAARRSTVEELLGFLREALPAQQASRASLPAEVLAAYLEPWATPAGMGAFFEIARQASPDALLALGPDRRGPPTLVIWGEADAHTPLEEGRRLAEGLGAPLQIVPGAGHLLPEEAPAALAERILAFVRGRAP